MRMGRGTETDEERSLYYKFRNKRHKALTKGMKPTIFNYMQNREKSIRRKDS